MLEEKYEIELPESIKKFTGYKNEKTKYIDVQKLVNFIEKISEINLSEEIELINKKND